MMAFFMVQLPSPVAHLIGIYTGVNFHLGNTRQASQTLLKMAIEVLDLPIKHDDFP